MIVAWWVLSGCATPTPEAIPEAEAAPEVEAPPATSAVEMVDAATLGERLSATSDQKRLVNFWATWCGPCKAELPHLKAWAGAHPEVDVVLVNLDYPKLRDKTVLPYIDKEGLGDLVHWQLDDPDPAKALRSAVPEWPDAVPVTLLIDESGTITKRFARALGPADFAQLP